MWLSWECVLYQLKHPYQQDNNTCKYNGRIIFTNNHNYEIILILLLYKITCYLFSRLKYENEEAIIQELIEKLYAVSKDHINKRKGIDEVGERQRRRKIIRLKEASKNALWFADTFNVDLLSLSIQARSSKEIIKVDFDTDITEKPSSSIQSAHNQALPILYLLDKFGVSTMSCL